MSIFEALLYGILQGFTEFLPVSSSAHLSLAQIFFSFEGEQNLTFTVLLHLGTLIAVLLVYYKDVLQLIKGFFTLIAKIFKKQLKNGLNYGEKLFLMIAIATIPLVPAVFAADYLEKISKTSWLIGIFLIINGGILYLSDKLARSDFTIETLKAKNALTVGLVQLLGLIPGISRSGSTITGGLFTGLNRKDAVKFSFLMSIPAILGANILEINDLIKNPMPKEMLGFMLAGMAAAAVSGLLAIKLLQYISKSNRLSVFSIYSFIIGTAAIAAELIF